MILQMIQIPIIYKYGMEKGMVIQMGIILALVLGLSALAGFIAGGFSISIEELISMMQKYGFIIVGVVVAIGYLLSYRISYRIYLKNE